MRGLLLCLKAGAVFVASAMAQGATFALLGLLSGIPVGQAENGPAAHPLLLLASYLPAIAVIAVAWRVFEKADQRALGHPGPPSRALSRLGLGFLYGGSLMGAVVGLGVALGGWSLSWEPSRTTALVSVALLLFVAAYFEELVMRGYLLQLLGSRFVMLGLFATSVLFAVLHLANPGAHAAPLATMLIVGNIVAAGLLMGTAFLRSQDLWWPAGIHFGWNWTQGMLMGLPVSGFTTPSLFHGTVLHEGSPVFGGTFGPESSLLGLLVMGLAAAEGVVAIVRRPRRLPMDARHVEIEIRPEPPAEVGPPAVA